MSVRHLAGFERRKLITQLAWLQLRSGLDPNGTCEGAALKFTAIESDSAKICRVC